LTGTKTFADALGTVTEGGEAGALRFEVTTL